jgi:hypothetical protein
MRDGHAQGRGAVGAPGYGDEWHHVSSYALVLPRAAAGRPFRRLVVRPLAADGLHLDRASNRLQTTSTDTERPVLLQRCNELLGEGTQSLLLLGRLTVDGLGHDSSTDRSLPRLQLAPPASVPAQRHGTSAASNGSRWSSRGRSPDLMLALLATMPASTASRPIAGLDPGTARHRGGIGGLAADRATGIGPGAAAGHVEGRGTPLASIGSRRGPWCAESGLTKALAAGRFTLGKRPCRAAAGISAMGHKPT